MAIFISYSSQDELAVRQLARDLEASRHDVWLDEKLWGGDTWWQSILDQILHCTVFVLALSNHSMRSKPCLAELSYAEALGLPILPVQIGELDSLRTLPVSRVQVVDYRERGASSGIALVGAVQDCVGRRRPLPQPLPTAPPIPYEYLSRLGITIASSDLSPQDQIAVVAQLRQALAEERETSVQKDILGLLRQLRQRPDVTYHTAGQIDAVLKEADGAPPYGTPPAPPPASGEWQPQFPPTSPRPGPAMAGFVGGPQPGPPFGVSSVPPPAVSPGQAAGTQTAAPVLSVIAFILAAIAVLFVPYLFGLLGVGCSIWAIQRKEKPARWALVVSIACTIIGLLLGALVGVATYSGY